MAGPVEDPGHGVAERRAAGVAGVQRARGVGRDELDHHVDAVARRSERPKPASPAATTSPTTSCSHDGRRSEVDEARAGELDRLDVGAAAPRSSRSTISWASSRGFRPACLAVAMATLDDQSPCSGRAGCSRPISAGASTPSCASAVAEGVGQAVADHERAESTGASHWSERSDIPFDRGANVPRPALVAQGIEHRPPEACARVRIAPRALLSKGGTTMGCCLVSLAAWISPRFVILLEWLFSDRLTVAFDSFWMGLVGFLFLPWTTVMFSLCYQPAFGIGISGFGYVMVGLGIFLDLASYAGGGRTAQQRQQQQLA